MGYGALRKSSISQSGMYLATEFRGFLVADQDGIDTTELLRWHA